MYNVIILRIANFQIHGFQKFETSSEHCGSMYVYVCTYVSDFVSMSVSVCV